MKGIIILLFVVYAAVGRAQNTVLVDKCPEDQVDDWTIEKLLRHEDCNKFYKCTFGKPVEYICPAALWFNLETQQCDWRHNVDCTDRYVPGEDPTTTTEPATTPTTTTTTPEPTTTTSTTTTTTPAPTTTTPTTTTTTTPAPTTTTTTPEPTTTTSTTTTTTPAPTTTTSTTTTTTPAPTTTTTTTTTPAPTTTTSTTTTTTPAPTTTTTTTTTPAPTTTPTTTTTTTPVPTTTSTTTTTPAPTTTTSTTAEPITFLPNGCPTNPHIHWLLPHESDCNAFYYCVWGQLVLRECPSTLHFNRVIQVCDWPWDAGCPVSLNKHLDSRQLMR